MVIFLMKILKPHKIWANFILGYQDSFNQNIKITMVIRLVKTLSKYFTRMVVWIEKLLKRYYRMLNYLELLQIHMWENISKLSVIKDFYSTKFYWLSIRPSREIIYNFLLMHRKGGPISWKTFQEVFMVLNYLR